MSGLGSRLILRSIMPHTSRTAMRKPRLGHAAPGATTNENRHGHTGGEPAGKLARAGGPAAGR